MNSESKAYIDSLEREVIDRMKVLTEDQIIHALYVEASVLINKEKNADYYAAKEAENTGKAHF